MAKPAKSHSFAPSLAPGGIAKWPNATDCKSVGLRPSVVRIHLPPPRFALRATRGDRHAGSPEGEAWCPAKSRLGGMERGQRRAINPSISRATEGQLRQFVEIRAKGNARVLRLRPRERRFSRPGGTSAIPPTCARASQRTTPAKACIRRSSARGGWFVTMRSATNNAPSILNGISNRTQARPLVQNGCGALPANSAADLPTCSDAARTPACGGTESRQVPAVRRVPPLSPIAPAGCRAVRCGFRKR